MREAMHDRAKFWTPAPNWSAVALQGEGWTARRVAGLGQTLVSGDLVAAIAALAPGAPEVGLWGIADPAEAFSLRIARDRALLVTPSPLTLAPGWRGGWVATPCDDACAVLEISGAAMPEIVAEGTAANLEAGSRSAAALFAGVTAFLCRTAPQTARLHVESPFAAYLWTWLEGRISRPA